nr:hypothetical protein [uncultured Desulfobacter sp.]
MEILSVLTNYIHFISISIFVGVIFFIRFISTPLMRKLEKEGDQHANGLLIGAAVKVVRFGWIALGLIIIDGAFMMLTNSHYKGFLMIDWNDNWQAWMSVKHIACVGLMASFLAYTLLVIKNGKQLKKTHKSGAAGAQMDIVAALNVLICLALIFCTAVIKYGQICPKVFFYTLHLWLIGCWIGGLFFVIFIGTPLIKGEIMAKKLPFLEGIHHMQMIANRFIKLLWLALFVAIFTGFPIMFLDSKFTGFMTIFSGINLVMFIKIIIFLITILGAFVVTPAIARLGLLLEKSMANPHQKEAMGPPAEEILKERGIIINAARYGFVWLQTVLIISAVLNVMK